MKEQLITILEALRLAKAEMNAHNARRVKNAPVRCNVFKRFCSMKM
jgi:hypothetical protein